jgi:hypothetical protein
MSSPEEENRQLEKLHLTLKVLEKSRRGQAGRRRQQYLAPTEG